MAKEALEWLLPCFQDSDFPVLVDCTMGEAGHALAFLSANPALYYVGIDADPAMRERAHVRLEPFGDRVTECAGYFDEVLDSFVDAGGVTGIREVKEPKKVRAVLFDLGISMFHFSGSGRGFALSRDEVLDMRLSPDLERSASDILAEEREEELARIFHEYGEERYSRRIARAIVEGRRSSRITSTSRLAELVAGAVPGPARKSGIHCATRTFQALRIAVNDELGRAGRGIRAAASLLDVGGRIGVISFHSLEDRIAKTIFRDLSGYGKAGEDGQEFKILTRKPLLPSESEQAGNPASRSAKFRVIERCALSSPEKSKVRSGSTNMRGRRERA